MHWYYILWIVMTNLVGASIGLLISAISKSHITALSLIPVVIIPQILLAGALIEYNQINPFLYLKKAHSTHSLNNKVPEFCNLIPLRWSAGEMCDVLNFITFATGRANVRGLPSGRMVTPPSLARLSVRKPLI